MMSEKRCREEMSEKRYHGRDVMVEMSEEECQLGQGWQKDLEGALYGT